MKKDDLKTAVKQQINDAEGYYTDELSANREKALDYYYGRPRGDEEPGASVAISMDVADMLEATIAGMLPAFDTNDVIEFEALSEDDVQAVKLESEAVSYFIMEENNGYLTLQEAFRDALLLKNGFVRVHVKETIDTTTDKLEGLTEDEYIGAFAMANPDDETSIELINPIEKDGLIDVTRRTTKTKRQLCVYSVDPTCFLYTSNWHEPTLDNVPFCAERCYYTRSELIEMGFKRSVVENLDHISLDTHGDNQARNQGEKKPKQFISVDKSTDVIECYWAYYRIDYDNDGIAELRRIFMAGDEILSNDPFEYVPYATGTAFLQPHRIEGLSLYDKLKQVQDQKTTTLRQYLDNFKNGNNPKMGYVTGMVNLDDLTSQRPGGRVAMERPDALTPIPTQDIGPSSLALLGYLDQTRSERGGASLDMQNANAQLVGETAQGIERQYSVKEQLAAMMTKTLAETLISSIWRITHKALRLERAGKMIFPSVSGFSETNPADWPERNKVNVKSGLSFAERNKKTQALSNVLQQMSIAAQAGQAGVLFTMQGYYDALIDLAKASGLDNAEQYYQNPQSPDAQKAIKGQQQQQQQMQQMQMQQQQMIQAMQQQAAAFEKYKHDSDLQFKYYKEQLEAALEEAKFIAGAEKDFSLAAANKQATATSEAATKEN